MVAKDYKKTKGSTKAEVGEIDTSAPFQSVKDAVSLFGEGAFSGEKPAIKKPKPQSAEWVLAKETQLLLAQNVLTKLKEQLENAETTKVQALLELEKAKWTVEDLSEKLKIVNESKDSAIRAAEVAKNQAKQFSEGTDDNFKGTIVSCNMDLETAKVRYMAAVTELEAAKLELWKIRQEYDASMEAKEMTTKQVAEADSAVKTNMGRVGELSKEITAMQDSIQQVNLASAQAMEEETKICADMDKQKQFYRAKLEESGKKLLALKIDVDPELSKNLETQLGGTLSEIEALRNKLDHARAADLDSVKTVTIELNGAKESLNKMAEEEGSLRCLGESLELELETTRKEHFKVKEMEAEAELIAANLNVELQKVKSEFEEALAEEAKVRGSSDDMIASIHLLSSESRNAKHEAQDMKQKAEELEREAGATRIELEEAEKKLRVIMSEAEEAKADEIRSLDQIKMLSEKTDVARASTSEPAAQITISSDEFVCLSRKVEESEKLADMKVAAAMAQVEALKASENEALRRLEATQKEIEDLKAATQEVLKTAEMAEAAKKAVEGELRRWREREQMKAAEAASRILAETDNSFESIPHNYQFQKQSPQEEIREARKLEKVKTSVGKKVPLPSLTSVFRGKKNKVEGGSPFLPGEKPVWCV